MGDYPRGSEWRKWDLHIHTASSYDADYKGSDSDKLLCKALMENNIAAVAITDHFVIDSERILHLRELAPDITFFPGVELRTDKGAANLHLILIFSEKTDLRILEEDFEAIMRRQKAKSSSQNKKIYWTFEDIIDFANGRGGLVSIHAGKKTNGIDREITNATPVNEAIKEDIAKKIHFFEIGQKGDIEDYNNIVFKFTKRKPLILCSDNHDSRNYFTKETLWIKADPRFEGLIQCVYQPTERVYVGDIPPKLDKVEKSKRTYIESVSVRKSSNAKNSLENWFDFNIPINCGLTAIIGNKGSGKSAFSDIIGHLCKSRAMNKASFLNENRFRKSPKNLANDYLGSIKWLDQKSEENISLGEVDYGTTIENVQYLPQKFIEEVCNDLEDEFQREINKVIFSYVDSTEKGDAKNLSELVEYKSFIILNKVKGIQNELSDINKEIIRLEDRLTSTHKNELIDNLKKREDDLRRHESARPKEVPKPERDQSKEYQNTLNRIEVQIKELQDIIESKKRELTDINKKIDRLDVIKSEVENLVDKIESINDSFRDIIDEFEFEEKSFKIKYSTPLTEIEKKIEELIKKRRELQAELDNSETAHDSVSLFKKLNLIVKNKQDLISEADAEEKAYQKYLNDVKDWEKTKSEIIGNSQIEGSIEYLKAEIENTEKLLPIKYEAKKDQRILKVKELFGQKKELALVYSSIYKPVEKELQKLLYDLEDKIEFTVDIVISDKAIDSKLLEFINQTYKGVFSGKSEAQNKMDELIKKTELNNIDSFCTFINAVLECVYEDIDISSKKVKNKETFYNLLTFINYIGVEYSLKMGGRNLKELSPGERGIVLLVFYLALSKNDVPLIV